MPACGVRFSTEHRFPAVAADVIGVLLDPEFHLQLDLPDLARPTVMEHEDDGAQGVVRLRYEFVGQLEPMVQRLLGGRALTWIQELRLNRGSRTGSLSFAAEASKERLHGEGSLIFVEDHDGTTRTIDGEVVVDVPLVSRMAERRILPGLLRRLDIEAEALNRRLAAR